MSTGNRCLVPRAVFLATLLALGCAQPSLAQLQLLSDYTEVYAFATRNSFDAWPPDGDYQEDEDGHYGPGSASVSASVAGSSAAASVSKSFASSGGAISVTGFASSSGPLPGQGFTHWAGALAVGEYSFEATEPVVIRVVRAHSLSDSNPIDGNTTDKSSSAHTVSLAAGDWHVVFAGWPDLAVENGSFSASTVFSVDTLPGETKGNPHPWEDDEDYEPIVEPDAITGFNLTGFAQFPVVDDTGGNSFDYGRDNYVYVGASSAPLVAASAELESEGAGGASYLFAVGEDSPNFSHFTIPDPLPGGDDTFLLEFEGFSEPYTAGTEFDFTALVPGGVSLFSVSGVDGVDPGQDLPGVQGFRFVEEGVAQVFIATVPVPEPSTLALALLGAAGLVFARRRRRVASFPVVTHDSVRRCPR